MSDTSARHKVAYLYFHSPCFDGIVSCVLVWGFLETTQGWNVEHLHPVTYSARENWLSTELKTPCAVVDFLYHPQAQFWADHHLTTFLSPQAKTQFEARKNPWWIYSEFSGSCALLLWDRLARSFGYRNSRYQEMVEWADKIDSARYMSVNEAIFGDAPALRISASLALKNGSAYSAYLARELRSRSLEQVVNLPEVRERSERARSMILAGLDRFDKVGRLDGNDIAIFDIDVGDDIVSRYAPYYFFPEARYSAGIVRSSQGAKITAMRNPWREFPSVFLGKIFEKFGGGGHQRVGSVLLTGDRAAEAPSILRQLLDEIRAQETSSKIGATT